MLSMNEAVKNLIEMFANKSFPEQIALTIIKRRSGEDVRPCDKWSIGNQLIMLFIGGTDDARTLKQWNAVGRKVMKGSKAFGIYAPLVKKIVDGEEEEQTVIVGFKVVPVFKVEDTEGEELEAVSYEPEIREMPQFIDVAEKLDIKVKWKPLSCAVYGYYSPRDNSITLGSKDFIVYFHELAHAVNATYADLSKDIKKAEVVAELTAAVLCEMNGISGYESQAYKYIQRFCADMEDKAVLKNIMRTLNEVEKIIGIILDASTYGSEGRTVSLRHEP